MDKRIRTNKNLILSFLEKAENKTKEVVSNEEVNVSQTESEE